MKDIEKLFSEKLSHHEVVPPTAAWETLAEALQQKRRQRRAGYRWVAAALLLLGTTTVLLIGLNPAPENALPVAQQPAVVAGPLAADHAEPANDPAALPDKEIKPVAQRPASKRAPALEKPTAPMVSSPRAEEPKHPEELPVTTPPVLAERAVKGVPLLPQESAPTNPTLVVDASRYKKADSTADEATEPVRPAEVTVIYQPNPSTLAKKSSLGQRIDKTLTFIQDHGISFSELRSAKSDFINKVFSNEKPDEPLNSTTP